MAAIERFRGDTKSMTVTIRDKDGVIVPVIGLSLHLAVSAKENPIDETDADYALEKDGVVIGDGTAGQFLFEFFDADVDFVGDYYYDMQFTDANGKTDTLTKDAWIMAQDIGK